MDKDIYLEIDVKKVQDITNKKQNLPNLVKYKYERLFNYSPLEEKDAPRGINRNP